jgi:hypothetical protein
MQCGIRHRLLSELPRADRLPNCGKTRLERTWATWHYSANRDLVALMHLGGWRSEKTVSRYAHVNVAHLAQSIAALSTLSPVQNHRN